MKERLGGDSMFKETLNQAIQYYKTFHYILIVDENGVIEYSSMYDKHRGGFINEDITGMHILEVYPSLNPNESTVLECLKEGKIIYDSLQKIDNFQGETSYFLNTDFPIISNGKAIGVIETSKKLKEDEYKKLLNKSQYTQKDLYTVDDIITIDPALKDIKNRILQISNSTSPVLIVGNTGTGKDMVAQSIHNHSYRCHKPFIVQNCAAIPTNLLESIFFGTVKGAFTGAENSKGLFEAANNGTLFLDEINSMDVYLQSKLLRVVEEKKFRPIGSTKAKNVDVRIIAALNVDPLKEVREGRLREDLYYRLGVLQLHLPSLKDRKDDIIYLTNHFIQQYNETFSKDVRGLSDLARQIFLDYPWNGNVRELQNVIEYIFNFIDNDLIQVNDLPNYLYTGEQKESRKSNMLDFNVMENLHKYSLKALVDNYEKYIIQEAISNTDNLASAANLLKISPSLLQYKLNKYKLK